MSLLLCSALLPLLCLWKISGGASCSFVSALRKEGRKTLKRKCEGTFQFALFLPAGQVPKEGTRGEQSTGLVNGEVLSAPLHIPQPLFGWAAVITTAGALSPCFQRGEIWQGPFGLYIDNNPFVSKNHKGPQNKNQSPAKQNCQRFN